MIYRPSGFPSDLDPRLQWIVSRSARGFQTPRSASTDAGDIAVEAKVADVAQWVGRSDVRMGGNLGQIGGQDHIVTGRIPAKRIESVRKDPNVRSLKLARPVMPVLTHTPKDVRCRPEDLPTAALGAQGAGVVIGVIDFGCDFAHANFRNPDGSTRIETIWDQNATAREDSPFGYGRVFTRSDIDAALTQAGPKGDPYALLGYGPPPDVPGRQSGSHGTHVMDIAAGNGLGSGLPGVAPAATLIFVELAASDVPWEGSDVVGRTFGDSVQMLEAILYIFEQAGDRPCVINMSLGTNGGPHDGSTLVELGIDAQIAARPNRAVVIAASNSYDDGNHGSGTVPVGGSVDIPWLVAEGDRTHNEMEIWYAGTDEFMVDLIAAIQNVILCDPK